MSISKAAFLNLGAKEYCPHTIPCFFQ